MIPIITLEELLEAFKRGDEIKLTGDAVAGDWGVILKHLKYRDEVYVDGQLTAIEG